MRLETDKESLQKEQDHLRTEINELYSQVKQAAGKANAERNGLEQQIQKLEDEGAAQAKELNILRQSSDAAGTEYQVLIDKMKAELDSAQVSISELNQANQQLLSERNDSDVRLNESLAGAREHTEKLENELKSAHASLQASEKEYLGKIADFEVKLQEATQRQTELEAKKISLNEGLADLEKTLAKEKAERGELATAFEKSTNDQGRLSKELAEVKANLEQENRAKQEIEERCSSLEQQRGRLEKELGEIKQAGNDADAQHRHLLSSLRAELDQAKLSITDLNRSHEQQLTDRNAAESSLKSALSESDKQIKRLESELTSAHETFKSAELSLAQQVADLEGQLLSEQQDGEEKKKSLRQAESNLQAMTEKHSQLEARLSEAQTNDASLRQDLDNKVQKLEELQQKYAEIQQEVAAADTEHTETLNTLQEKLVVTEAEVKEYAEALSKTRLELKKQNEEKTKLTARLEEEQHKSDFLKRSLATAEDAIEISDSAFNERGDELDALKIQFEEFESVRDDLEKRLKEAQENLNLKEMSLQETEQSHSDALEKLNKELVSVNAEREKVKAEDIEREAARKIEFEVLQAEKSEIEMELAELQNRLEAQIQALEVSETDRQQEIQRLLGELSAAKSELQQLASAKGEAHDSAAALQAAHEEIARLNKNIDGLREVQLEMESQLSDDSEEEILKLRSALEQEERKRRNAEELARQADVLKREREVQETAVEMLGEDLDELTLDKKQLEEDKKILERKLAEMRSQFSDLMDENNHLHTEMSEFRGQVDDSSMTDDLLAQLEELRLKTEVFEQERDGARSDADRLKREVHELRSVIETYVEQIQDVQSYEGNDELTALRSELDMVRNQASADLQQMRKELSAAKGKVASLGGRDTNDAASLQAQRQEIDTTRQALHEKEHMLRLSQTQCRTLEDSIEDRDREVDQLKRKLELLIRKTGGLGEFSESIDSDTVMSHKAPPRGQNLGADHLEGLQAHGQPVTGNDQKASTFGRLFRKK